MKIEKIEFVTDERVLAKDMFERILEKMIIQQLLNDKNIDLAFLGELLREHEKEKNNVKF